VLTKNRLMKGLFVIGALVLTLNSFAQKFKVGIQAGYNSATLVNETGTSYIGLDNINTFHFGGIAEFELGSGFYGQSGLLYTQKGCQKYPTNLSLGSTTTLNIAYLELPLNVEYKIKLSKSWKVLVGTGFYISRGLVGTEKGTDNTTGVQTTVNNSVHFTNDNTFNSTYTSVNPYDFGYNLLVGTEYKNFQLKVNLNNGFSKVLTQGSTRFQNQIVNVSAGYLFKI